MAFRGFVQQVVLLSRSELIKLQQAFLVATMRAKLMPNSHVLFFYFIFFFIACPACALKFLHERNISHLDLKPQNILLSGNVLKLAGTKDIKDEIKISLITDFYS